MNGKITVVSSPNLGSTHLNFILIKNSKTQRIGRLYQVIQR